MTEDLESPATLQQPAWKPQHRVEPRRPANPHPADDWQPPDMTDYPDRGHKAQHRETPKGPNLFAFLIVAVIILAAAFLLSWLIVLNYGAGR